MSDDSTRQLIALYMDQAEAPMFLSGFFQSPPQNFHNSEKVEIDVIRDDAEVAVVISSMQAGPRGNEANLYTNKAFVPPVYDEKGAITAYELIKRMPGQNPFQDPNFGANATTQAFRLFHKLERKIRRAVERQSSQVLQTGALDLPDQNGVVLYHLDFEPKASHFPTAGVAWAVDGSTGNPLADLEALALELRRDGKNNPSRLIFGASAMRRFIANAKVKDLLDKTALNLAEMAPKVRGQGATFRGWIWIGHYRFEMWMYDGFYKDPQSGEPVSYVADNNVIMLSETGRLDLSFGAIPMIVGPESRALPFLPPLISSTDRGLALTTNSWITDDGKSLMVSAGTRPLTIPTAIDTFGCITVA